jgi:cytochrome c oxidase subunit IV
MATAEHHHADHADHILPVATYLIVFAVLLGLLVITFGAAFVNLGNPIINFAIAMTIAIVKAGLILWYFMHVKFGTRLVWVYAIGSFAWLLVLFGITLGDYMTRHWEDVLR